MNDTDTNLDRAQWNRFASKGGRCLICGRHSVVSVTIMASDVSPNAPARKQGQRSSYLAKETIEFCNEHGIQRYADALTKLSNTAAR